MQYFALTKNTGLALMSFNDANKSTLDMQWMSFTVHSRSVSILSLYLFRGNMLSISDL